MIDPRRTCLAIALCVIGSLPSSAEEGPVEGISGNPAAVDVPAGSGFLGRLLGFGPDSGVYLGGVWAADANYLISGGIEPRTWSFNSLLIVDFNLDLDKAFKIPGAKFGVGFLQFDGQLTNAQAGVVTDYNNLAGPEPLGRSELYELWWRQQLFDGKLFVKIGKFVATQDFNDVSRPVPLEDKSLFVPALSGLIYAPLFANTTLFGVMPGSYNSAYAVTVTAVPTKNFYVSAGAWDGNGYLGVQTGLEATPEFNGHYFLMGETGYTWLLGPSRLPGTIAIGGWRQTGQRTLGPFHENGTEGFYTFGSQSLWIRRSSLGNSGIAGFFQFGINDSETLPVNKYFGTGITGFGLVPGRHLDSMGGGVAVSWLNEQLGLRSTEVILQAYYQAHVVGDIFAQPTITYVPNPGVSSQLSPATAVTMRLTVPF